MITRSSMSATFSLSATLLAAAVASAQTGNETGASLEEIVVTAQKRAERLQEVPLAVSAVTAQGFERFASPDIADLSGAMPNVYMQPTAGGSSILAVAIRGIQYAENEKSIEPPVGVVVDGVYLGTAQGGLLETFDIERLEVLRGPQGTLFGKNTTGGVVNAIRTRPTGEFGAKLGATVGSFDRRELKAVLNFPIARDLLAGKVSVFHEEADGVPHLFEPGRTDGDRDYWAGSVSLLFTPTDSLELQLTYDLLRDRGEGPAVFNMYQRTPTTLPTNPAIVLPPDTPCGVLNLCPAYDLKHSRIDNSGIAHADSDAITANLKWNLAERLTFISITGWRDAVEEIANDFDATEQSIFHTLRPHDGFEQLSQEFRLEGELGDAVDFVAGLFYFDSDYETEVSRVQDFGYIRGNPALIGVRSLLFPGATISSRVYVRHRSESLAAFAQVDFDITSKLTLTTGARFTRDEKRMIYELRNPDGTVIGPAQGAQLVQSIDTEDSWEEFTPRVALQYRFTDDLQAYGSFTRGFNAGGYSGRAPDILTVGPYEPEIVDAIEVGLKSEWLERRLRLNLALFRNDYSDKQEEVNRNTSIPPFFGTTVTNASSATIQGVELEASAVPAYGLTLDASLGYLDAQYDDFTADITGRGVTDNSDLKLRRAPELTASGGGEYRFAVGPGEAAVRARYRYIGEHELAVTNDPLGHVKGTGYVDASTSYEFELGGVEWLINAYGRNLTDEIRPNVYFRTGGFLAFTSAPLGREYGVELTATF